MQRSPADILLIQHYQQRGAALRQELESLKPSRFEWLSYSLSLFAVIFLLHRFTGFNFFSEDTYWLVALIFIAIGGRSYEYYRVNKRIDLLIRLIDTEKSEAQACRGQH